MHCKVIMLLRLFHTIACLGSRPIVMTYIWSLGMRSQICVKTEL
jgi:hypothetical protein